MIVAAAHTVGTQHAGTFVELGRESCQEPGVSEGAKIFRRIEAECCQIPKRAGGRLPPFRAERLRCILYQEQPMTLVQGAEGVPVSTLSVEMNREDGFDARASVVVDDPINRLDGEVVSYW